MANIDEAARLAALSACNIMDTPREMVFDRIVFVAASVLRVPMAGLALIGAERVWAKALVGSFSPEGPRASSIYDRAIQLNAFWTVSDAAADPELASHPVVTGELSIRFFAAAPVYGPQRQAVGVLCVSDRMPKVLKPAARAHLLQLAAEAGELLRQRVAGLNLDVETRPLIFR